MRWNNIFWGKETVSLEELSTQFSVSMNTIRRDVMELLSRGNIRKVYGGVSSTLINRPVGFSVRAQKNSRAKQIIGRLASQLVSDGASIFLDSGSTTPYILQHIGEKNGVTVITHSLTAPVCGLVFVQPEHYCAGRYLRPRHVVLYRYFHTGCPLSPEHSDNLYLCYRRFN